MRENTDIAPSPSPSPPSSPSSSSSPQVELHDFQEPSPFGDPTQSCPAISTLFRTKLVPKPTATFAALYILTALLLRVTIGYFPHSGENTPPLFGDYEAQRHWMEICSNLPPKSWYAQIDGINDLDYWGLDYPPLSGYLSWGFGVWLRHVEKEAVELVASRGYESESSRLFMRNSVIICDLIFWMPAIWMFLRKDPRANHVKWITMTLLLICPALLLIDHGHFQYNSVSLGLFIYSMYFFITDQDIWGVVMYCFSLCFKQMGLYYSVGVAAYLVSKCWHEAERKAAYSGLAIIRTLSTLLIVSLAAAITLYLCFIPWTGSVHELRQVLARIFPVSRGLFEDKVANFWCTTGLIIKWSRLSWLSAPSNMTLLCAFMTLIASLPFCFYALQQKPTPKKLLLCTAGSALSFYLFSYQVHEKQILLPLVPVSLLVIDAPLLAFHMNLFAAYSMFPLLNREGLALPYICCQVLLLLMFGGIFDDAKIHPTLRRGLVMSLAGLALTHLVQMIGPPVPGLPDIYTYVITGYSFVNFCVDYLCLFFLIRTESHHDTMNKPKTE